MKVLIAIDSFKGCMSSKEAGRACAEGIWRARPRAETVVMPMADGGEGTMDAIVEGLKGEYVECRTAGPYGSEVTARYGVVNKRKAAVIEAAQATGLVLVERLGLGIGLNPWKATTRGVGQMILHAAERGCRDFVIGTGGSAATEGGIGMLEALGCAFYGADGQRLPAELASLAKIGRIDRSGMAGVLQECYFRIACDVKNPLCGKNGAVNVFGAQRGVKAEEKGFLDAAMFHFADKTLECTGKDYRGRAGSGAAGGLGFAFMSYLPHVELVSGVDLMLQTTGLEKKLKGADIVVTGEGRLDAQTVLGKVPLGVARIAKKHHLKVIAFAGTVSEDAWICNEAGIDAFFPIVRESTSLDAAMDPGNAKRNMTMAAEQVFRLLS